MDTNDIGMDESDPELEVEVLAYVETFAERIGAMLAGAATGAEAAEMFRRVVLEDQGAVILLARAFEDGRRDGLMSSARFADAHGPGLDWSGVEGGERLAIWHEGHTCNECVHGSVCVVPRSIPAEMLVQVKRCLAFSAKRG